MRVERPWKWLVLAAVIVCPAGWAQPDDERDDLDPLALAAVLVGDGHHERARKVLAGVDMEDESLDRVRYHSLDGLVALHLDELARAVNAFRSAIDVGDPPDVIRLYLAQAHFGLEEYAETLAALERAGAQATHLPSVYLMRSQAHRELGEPEAAWRALAAGRAAFPERAGDFVRRQVLLLVDRGLYRQAAETGRAWLEESGAGVDDAVAIGNALREAGEHARALRVLEAARLRDPDNPRLAKVLAHTWLGRDHILPAADILRTAARAEPELLVEAAELYRRAGSLVQALTLNAQVIDQPAKLRQRLAILIEMGRFEQAAAMEESLVRNALMDDENIRYALAYALFKTGHFDDAERHLGRLTDGELFRKATELRRAMEQCGDSPWLCG